MIASWSIRRSDAIGLIGGAMVPPAGLVAVRAIPQEDTALFLVLSAALAERHILRTWVTACSQDMGDSFLRHYALENKE
jgi:hypothetical protein